MRSHVLRSNAKRTIALTAAIAVLASQVPLLPAQAQIAQSLAPEQKGTASGRTGIASSSSIMSRAEYETCQAKDEASFRGAMEEVTYKGLRTGLAGVEYNAVVREEWRRLDLDQVLDKQIDTAIAQVTSESSWTELIKSIGSKEQAQALANAVAERVFKSVAVEKALEQLANSVGKALGKRIEMATADTAEPAMQCMQAFLGPRYGNTVARAFSKDAGKEYQIDSARNSAEVSSGSVLASGAGGITGAVILIVRRQLTNMAARIGSRVVGSVVARVVGVVAGGVGLVLIAKDIWDFRHGVMPIIASEMKSKETKTKVQEELARAIQEQISENLRDIAKHTADRILEVWKDFKAAHARVLDLAEKTPRFKAFLEQLKPEALARLDEVVSLVLPKEGDAGVLTRLDNGSLNDAVNRLPAAALDIARDTRSIDIAMQWWALAGDDVGRVVEADLHKLTTPQTLTKATFTRLIRLDDKVALSRLAGLPTDTRNVLFELETSELRRLGHALEAHELTSLAGYLTGLDRSSSRRVLSAVAQTPSKMQVLSKASVRHGILASRDQSVAVDMMLKSEGALDPFVALDHLRLVMDGKVSPILLWQKNPWAVGVFALSALWLLLLLKRLFFGRRPKVIVQKVQVPTANGPAPMRTAASSAPAPASSSGSEPKRAANAPPIRTRR